MKQKYELTQSWKKSRRVMDGNGSRHLLEHSTEWSGPVDDDNDVLDLPKLVQVLYMFPPTAATFHMQLCHLIRTHELLSIVQHPYHINYKLIECWFWRKISQYRIWRRFILRTFSFKALLVSTRTCSCKYNNANSKPLVRLKKIKG